MLLFVCCGFVDYQVDHLFSIDFCIILFLNNSVVGACEMLEKCWICFGFVRFISPIGFLLVWGLRNS